MQVGVPFTNPVHEGRLIRRYKRFLVDFELNGQTQTAHTSNTGSMTGMLQKGAKVLVTYDKAPHRKLDYTLQAISVDGIYAAANPILSNRFARALFEASALRGFCGYSTVKSEVKVNDHTRLDFLLSDHAERPDLYVEVKSATLVLENMIQFPDAVSERAVKHIQTLSHLASQGHRALCLFIAQREGRAFCPAYEIDPTYADALHAAHKEGVQLACVSTEVNESGVWLSKRIPVELRRSW